MTIKEAIKKAIDGGYNEKHVQFVMDGSVSIATNFYKIFLDPSFWQSLGSAMGWKNYNLHSDFVPWKKEWHRFIDHIADGCAPETFFKDLN